MRRILLVAILLVLAVPIMADEGGTQLPVYKVGDNVNEFIIGPAWDFMTTQNRDTYPTQAEMESIYSGAVTYRIRIVRAYVREEFNQFLNNQIAALYFPPSTPCNSPTKCQTEISALCKKLTPSATEESSVMVTEFSLSNGWCEGVCHWDGPGLGPWGKFADVDAECDTKPPVEGCSIPPYNDTCPQCEGDAPNCQCNMCLGENQGPISCDTMPLQCAANDCCYTEL